MKELNEKIIDALEAHNFGVCSNDAQAGAYVAELETSSPKEFEDVTITIWHDGTIPGFVMAFREYANDFNADEYAAECISNRRKNGWPYSVRAEIDDAEAIKKMLDDVADALEKIA